MPKLTEVFIVKEDQNPKPPLTKVAGKFLQVHAAMFKGDPTYDLTPYSVQQKHTKYDDITPQQWKWCWITDDKKAMGEKSVFQIMPDGSLKFVESNVDSSG